MNQVDDIRAQARKSEQQLIDELAQREAEAREDVYMIEEPSSTEEELWNALLATYRKLKAAKPEDRSEKARRYAITITEYEKMLSIFNTMVWENLEG